jgi:aspartate/methionine/tyrosine aminotransferase
VVADEIYEHINFQELLQHWSIPGMFDKTITKRSSKSFAMTGWRIDTLVPQNLLLKHVQKFKVK